MTFSLAEILLKKEIFGFSHYIEIFKNEVNSNKLILFQIEFFDFLIDFLSLKNDKNTKIKIKRLKSQYFAIESFLIVIDNVYMISSHPDSMSICIISSSGQKKFDIYRRNWENLSITQKNNLINQALN